MASEGRKEFARPKGIKTVILRTFQESDWERRVRKNRSGRAVITSPPDVAMGLATPDDDAKLRRDMQEAGL